MSKRKLLLLLLLFVVYVVVVWLISYAFFPDNMILVGLILTACGLTVLFVYVLIARMTSRLSTDAQGGQKEAAPPSPPPAHASQNNEDVDSISSVIAEANDRLLKSPTLANSKIRPSVTGLPLYLLLGVEGSGKTSLFVGSEMLPELLAGEVYRDQIIVPTPLLNLWFAAEGIIAEPSGRFFSEDPGRLKRIVALLAGKRGVSFITRMISGERPGEQFQGVILCCPIDALQGIPDTARQAALVRRIQERLRAIGETIGRDFPVYVVFTKCDWRKVGGEEYGIKYFAEYFARLTGDEDKQILGCTLPLAARDGRTELYTDVQTKRVSDLFNQLYYSLSEHRQTLLRRESNRSKKPDVYEFPRELRRVRGPLIQFLVDLFRPNPLQPGPFLRGFYFTGTREVAASEASAAQNKFRQTATFKLGQATRLFGQEDLKNLASPPPMPDDPGMARVWSFVQGLMRQILVGDRNRTTGGFVDRKLAFYRKIAFAAVAVVFCLFVVFFTISWNNNRLLLRDVKEAGSASRALDRPNDMPSQDQLLRLENLRAVLQKLTDQRFGSTPWSLTFGLYAGNSVWSAAHDLYFQRFHEYFLDRTLATVQNKLGSLPPAQDPGYDYKTAYDDLKGYLTVTKPEELRCTPDNEFSRWVTGPWLGNELAERQFQFYVSELRAKRDPYDLRSSRAAVTRGRSYLATFSGIEPLYQGIIAAVNQEMQTDAKLSDYTQRAPETLYLKAGGDVPAAFTRAGWDKVRSRIANAGTGRTGSACVVGVGQMASNVLQSSGSDTQRQLTSRYTRDYIDRWKAFLQGTTVQVPYRDKADAAKKLDVLAGNASPVLAVLAMTEDNTKVGAASPASSVLSQAQDQAKRSFWDKIRNRAPSAAASVIPQPQPGDAAPPANIADVFQPTQAVFAPTPTRSRLVDEVNQRYISALGDLQLAMNALAQQSDSDSNADLNSRANEKAQSALREAKQLALKFNPSTEGVSDLVSSFLEAPIDGAQRLIVTDPRKPEMSKLDGGLREVCSAMRPLLGKYPFKAQEAQEANLRELAMVFAPAGGAFQNFHLTYTQKFLEQRGSQWFVKPDAQINLTPQFLNFFNRMARISAALFLPGGKDAHAEFRMSLQTGAGYQSVTGTLDGDKFDSASPKQYSWPGQQPGVDLRVLPTGNASTASFAYYPELWGFFHWIQSAENRPAGSPSFGFVNQRAPGGGRPQAILESGAPILIQVNEFPGKVDNAFDRDFFTGIDCPMRAAQQ